MEQAPLEESRRKGLFDGIANIVVSVPSEDVWHGSAIVGKNNLDYSHPRT